MSDEQVTDEALQCADAIMKARARGKGVAVSAAIARSLRNQVVAGVVMRTILEYAFSVSSEVINRWRGDVKEGIPSALDISNELARVLNEAPGAPRVIDREQLHVALCDRMNDLVGGAMIELYERRLADNDRN